MALAISWLLCWERSGWAVGRVGTEDAMRCPRGGGVAADVVNVAVVIKRRSCGEGGSVVILAYARGEEELCG